jgi:hypothetical protein
MKEVEVISVDIVIEVRNPVARGYLAMSPTIYQVERLLDQYGCRIPFKSQKNGSVFIQGPISLAGAQEIRQHFCSAGGGVLPQYVEEVFSVSW